MARYDRPSGQWVSYLGGLSAQWLAFFADGEQVVYVGAEAREALPARN
jgi:hypothetical protein